MDNKYRIVLASAAVLAAGATAACNQPRFVDTPPPPPPYVEQQPYKEPYAPKYQEEGPGKPGINEAPLPPSEPYRDGPPPRRGGLAGGPPPPPKEPEFFKMQPVPNPDDLSPEEREKLYGPAKGKHAGKPGVHAPRGHGKHHAAPAHPAHKGKGAHKAAPGHPHAGKAAPAKGHPHKGVINPKGKAAPAPVHHAEKPAAHAAAPAPKAAAPAPKPGAPAPSPKASAPAPAPAPKAAPLTPAQTKLQQLGQALGPDVAAGAQLHISDEVSAGKEGKVTLTLPATLASRVQQEADKVGLGAASQKAEASATLTGDGYDISPQGPVTANLADGESATFEWTVKPQAGAAGTLSAQVGANLNGAAQPQSIDMGKVEPATTGPGAGASNPLLNQKVVGWGIVGLIGVILLGVLGRASSNRRAADRARRSRSAASLGEYGDGAPPPKV